MVLAFASVLLTSCEIYEGFLQSAADRGDSWSQRELRVLQGYNWPNFHPYRDTGAGVKRD
jgi:hypothetical protein